MAITINKLYKIISNNNLNITNVSRDYHKKETT